MDGETRADAAPNSMTSLRSTPSIPAEAGQDKQGKFQQEEHGSGVRSTSALPPSAASRQSQTPQKLRSGAATLLRQPSSHSSPPSPRQTPRQTSPREGHESPAYYGRDQGDQGTSEPENETPLRQKLPNDSIDGAAGMDREKRKQAGNGGEERAISSEAEQQHSKAVETTAGGLGRVAGATAGACAAGKQLATAGQSDGKATTRGNSFKTPAAAPVALAAKEALAAKATLAPPAPAEALTPASPTLAAPAEALTPASVAAATAGLSVRTAAADRTVVHVHEVYSASSGSSDSEYAVSEADDEGDGYEEDSLSSLSCHSLRTPRRSKVCQFASVPSECFHGPILPTQFVKDFSHVLDICSGRVEVPGANCNVRGLRGLEDAVKFVRREATAAGCSSSPAARPHGLNARAAYDDCPLLM
eukprot:GHVT01033093.1.p1 GENE.GHVT01033093.1~~GHVT01033093.1.p1  ORF type:complete len:417 (+),score=65.10 GHVT01033093.1:1756-3006(+)